MHYVVSDIHNDYQKFCELLKVIKLSKEDKLFILSFQRKEALRQLQCIKENISVC